METENITKHDTKAKRTRARTPRETELIELACVKLFDLTSFKGLKIVDSLYSTEEQEARKLVLIHYIENEITKEPLSDNPAIASIRGVLVEMDGVEDEATLNSARVVQWGLGRICTSVPLYTNSAEAQDNFLTLQATPVVGQRPSYRYMAGMEPLNTVAKYPARNPFLRQESDKPSLFGFKSNPFLQEDSSSTIDNTVLYDLKGNKFDLGDDPYLLQCRKAISVNYDGIHVRVIKYKGVVYHMSAKTLDIKHSRWGEANSPTFKEMYDQAKGPSNEDLFGQGVGTCSVGYSFMIVHQHMLVSSRQVVLAPYTVFLNKFAVSMEDTAETFPGTYDFSALEPFDAKTCGAYETNPVACNYLLDLLDAGKTTRRSFLENAQRSSYVYGNKTAEEFLEYGYDKAHQGQFDPTEAGNTGRYGRDYRYRDGESIAINFIDPAKDDNIVLTIRVYSLAAYWRYNLRSNNPNYKNQFYKLRDQMRSLSASRSKTAPPIFSLPPMPLIDYPPLPVEEYINLIYKFARSSKQPRILNPAFREYVEDYVRRASPKLLPVNSRKNSPRSAPVTASPRSAPDAAVSPSSASSPKSPRSSATTSPRSPAKSATTQDTDSGTHENSYVAPADINLWINYCTTLPFNYSDEGTNIINDYSSCLQSLTNYFYNIIIELFSGKTIDESVVLYYISKAFQEPLQWGKLPRSNFRFPTKVQCADLLVAVERNDFGMSNKNPQKQHQARTSIIISNVIGRYRDRYGSRPTSVVNFYTWLERDIIAQLKNYEETTTLYTIRTSLLRLERFKNKPPTQ